MPSFSDFDKVRIVNTDPELILDGVIDGVISTDDPQVFMYSVNLHPKHFRVVRGDAALFEETPDA